MGGKWRTPKWFEDKRDKQLKTPLMLKDLFHCITDYKEIWCLQIILHKNYSGYE